MTEATQILVCRIKSRKEKLNYSTLVSNYGKCIESEALKLEATHVVVGVTYGAEIYCVLTQDFGNEDDQDARDEAEENLANIISRMESSLDGNQNLTDFQEQFSKNEKQLVNRLKCRLYADMQTQSVRECNVFDAYKQCLKLKEQVQTTSKAVPISVRLCHLKAIAAKQIIPFDYRDVDSPLVARCCFIMAELDKICARAEAMKKESHASVLQFITALNKYKELWRESLKMAIIKARASPEKDDDEVERAVDIAENHPLFKPSRLEQWITFKQSEIEMAIKMVNLNGIVYLASKDQLEKRLDDSSSPKYALVLNFPPLDKRTNRIVDAMANYVDNTNLAIDKDDDDDDLYEGIEGLPWHTVQHKRKKVKAKIREFIDYVAKNKHLEDQVQFFITPDESGKKGCNYSIYENGNLLTDSGRLPVPPTRLLIRPTVNDTSICVEWQYEDIPCHFLVEYRLKGSSGPWMRQKTAQQGETKLIVNIQPGSEWEVRVAADTCIGRSEFSDAVAIGNVIDPIIPPIRPSVVTTIVHPPTAIEMEVVTQSTAEISWHESTGGQNRFSYLVRYWVDGQEDLAAELNVDNETFCRLESLQSETSYSVQIIAVSSDGQQKSEPSEIINLTTPANQQVRFAEMIVKQCRKINNRNGMDMYSVPLVKSSQSGSKVERFAFGKSKKVGAGRMQNRTILMMGATGSGKTTLINAMINYIFNVEWEDDFRFQLIDEQFADKSKVESQTSCIMVYDIHHSEGFRIPYSVTIVDTPGYGDTKGLARDEEITEMVRHFFEDRGGIQELDVVGFVVTASLPRLTPTQTYIFDSVLSIFGNDVKENINFLLTFSDSQDPPVLSAIVEANLPCLRDAQSGQPLHHKFNNSGFFCSNRESSGSTSIIDKFNKFFWRMGIENFEKFFSVLAAMKTKSLSLTKEVLEERKQLEATVEGLQPLIKIGLSKMEEMRKTNQILSMSQAQIEAKKNVTFEVNVTVPKKVDIPAGQYVTNCNKCHITCHYPCTIPNDDGKVSCKAMNHLILPRNKRTCRICPEKCIWNLHSNQSYKWEYVTQKKSTSSDAIILRYENEIKRKLTAEELINELRKDLEANDNAVFERVDTVTRCIQRLDEIALRPNPFSTTQYIDLIIKAEKQEKRPGFKERIESLKKLRQMAEITSKIQNRESLLSTDRVEGEPDIDLDDDADSDSASLTSAAAYNRKHANSFKPK